MPDPGMPGGYEPQLAKVEGGLSEFADETFSLIEGFVGKHESELSEEVIDTFIQSVINLKMEIDRLRGHINGVDHDTIVTELERVNSEIVTLSSIASVVEEMKQETASLVQSIKAKQPVSGSDETLRNSLVDRLSNDMSKAGWASTGISDNSGRINFMIEMAFNKN